MKIVINENQLMSIVNYNVIIEEKLGFFTDAFGHFVDVYKNPKSIEKFDSECRGYLTKNGDLFVVDDGQYTIHGMLGRYLREKGYDIPVHSYSDLRAVPLQRNGKTNEFYLGEGFSRPELKDRKIMHEILSILEVGKRKNPQFIFIPKSINDVSSNYDGDDYDVSSEW